MPRLFPFAACRPALQKVPISEEMAEELTPQKETTTENDGGVRRRSSDGFDGRGGETKGLSTEDERVDVLRELAKACKHQGNFHLACKKYTQVKIATVGGLFSFGVKHISVFTAWSLRACGAAVA